MPVISTVTGLPVRATRSLVRTVRRIGPHGSWRGLAAVLCLLAVLVGAGTGLAKLRVHTALSSFLPGNDASVRQLNQVDQQFGGEPVVVLMQSSKPEQLLDSQHLYPLLELEGRLAALPDVAVVYGPATVLNQIAGQMQDLLAELSGRRDAIQNQAEAQAAAAGDSQAQIVAAGQQALTDFDARYGTLLVEGLPVGLPTLSNPKFASSVIFSGQPVPRSQWRFVVPDANSVAVLVRPRQGLDAAASERLVAAVNRTIAAVKVPDAATTVSGAPALVAALNTEVDRELPLLGGIAAVAVALCFALVPWARRSRRLLPLASTVVATAITLGAYGWLGRSLSLGAVAAIPVLLGVGSYYPTYFARGATVRTVFVVATGTAVSFATLAISPLPFVRDIAALLAFGVIVCALVGWAVARRLGVVASDEPAAAATLRPRTRDRAPADAVPRRLAAVGVVALAALAAAGWVLLPRLSLQTDFESYADGLSALHQADRVQGVIGSSGELDVVLSGPDVLTTPAYTWLRQAQNLVVSTYGDRVHPVASIPTLTSFLGDTPTESEIQAAARLVPQYLLGATVTSDHRTSVLSFGVDLSDIPAVQAVIDGLHRSLPAAPRGYQYRIVGLPVVAARGAQLVSGDRLLTNVLGSVAAALVLAVGLRRRRDALRALVAACTASGLGFFALWSAGLSLSPLTACLGALTGAVASEFTVMLADAFRTADRRLRASVVLAFATSAIGYLSLTASSLAAIREFGVMLACAVALAFISAWCVVRATASQPTEPANTTSPATSRRVLEGVGS